MAGGAAPVPITSASEHRGAASAPLKSTLPRDSFACCSGSNPKAKAGRKSTLAKDTLGSPQEEARMAATETSTAPDALVERLFEGVLGMTEVYTVYMGDRLGLYEALADGNATEA